MKTNQSYCEGGIAEIWIYWLVVIDAVCNRWKSAKMSSARTWFADARSRYAAHCAESNYEHDSKHNKCVNVIKNQFDVELHIFSLWYWSTIWICECVCVCVFCVQFWLRLDWNRQHWFGAAIQCDLTFRNYAKCACSVFSFTTLVTSSHIYECDLNVKIGNCMAYLCENIWHRPEFMFNSIEKKKKQHKITWRRTYFA